MQVIKLTRALYARWDTFCAKSHDAWLWHTSSWLEYILCYNPRLESTSFSFLVEDDKQIVAICPLFLETHGDAKEFSFGGGHGPVPALLGDMSPRVREKVLKFIFSHVDSLAKEHGVRRASFRFPVLNDSFVSTRKQTFNYLLKFGYLDTSINTQLSEVGRSVEELRKEIRHGHTYDIDRAEKILTSEICAKGTLLPALFNSYVKMHRQGTLARKERPERTFEILFELLQSGNAFLIGAKKEDVYVGFAYFFVFKGNVYYGSACNDPKYGDIPIGHFLQWQAVLYMHKQHIRFYEIGWQRFTPTVADSFSAKEVSISKFMRGFGGYTVPLFRGEKYYDSAYFLKVYQERLKKSAEVIEGRYNTDADGKTI